MLHACGCVKEHNLTLLAADSAQGVKQHLAVRSLFQGSAILPLLILSQVLQCHIRLHLLLPEPHVAKVPGYGEHPCQRLALGNIGTCLGPYGKVSVLHYILGLLRIPG